MAQYALAAGYRVRGSVRNAKKRLESLLTLKGPTGNTLEFTEATLEQPEGWKEAVAGCTYVLHVASPVPTDKPKDEDAEVIQPAIAGVRHVLQAALAEPSVKRVVVVSSVAAIFEGRYADWGKRAFTEEDW